MLEMMCYVDMHEVTEQDRVGSGCSIYMESIT